MSPAPRDGFTAAELPDWEMISAPSTNGHGDIDEHRAAMDALVRELEQTEARTEAPAGSWRSQIVDGAAWLRSGSDVVVARWGADDAVPMPTGQPTFLVGRPGAGKTTVAQNVMLGTIGCPGYGTVLGWPVLPIDDGNALYLASDRPDQARLSMRRMVTTAAAWDTVERRLRVWQGPPPTTLATQPGLLLEMAQAADARFVVVDSLKDMALRLSEDETGGAINLALQLLVAHGIDVVALHHPRKATKDNADARPTMDDLYGSAWMAAGAGSVLFFTKGPLSIEATQAKTPNGNEISFRFRIDLATGKLASGAEDEVLAAIRDAGPAGISTKAIARWVLQITDPTEAQVEQVRRRAKALEGSGMVETTGVGKNTRWVET